MEKGVFRLGRCYSCRQGILARCLGQQPGKLGYRQLIEKLVAREDDWCP